LRDVIRAASGAYCPSLDPVATNSFLTIINFDKLILVADPSKWEMRTEHPATEAFTARLTASIKKDPISTVKTECIITDMSRHKTTVKSR
jgi:hypothetical protein